MNSDSEQTAPAVDVAPRSGRGVLGWILATTMTLVWYAFWGFWLSPIEQVSKAGSSGAPTVTFLPEPGPGGEEIAADARAIWSPAVFSLPSEVGFSRGALTNGIGGRPPLQGPGSESLFLAPPAGAARESEFRYAPDLEDSVRGALTNLPDRVPEAYVFGATATTGTGVQVELSSGLERRRIRAMDVPPDDVLLKDKPWEVSAFVEFNREGKVSGVFLETKSSFEDVDAWLIHALWRWQVEDAKEPLHGRVMFRSPGRPQLAVEPQNTVVP
jgi:hypothetical protein